MRKHKPTKLYREHAKLTTVGPIKPVGFERLDLKKMITQKHSAPPRDSVSFKEAVKAGSKAILESLKRLQPAITGHTYIYANRMQEDQHGCKRTS